MTKKKQKKEILVSEDKDDSTDGAEEVKLITRKEAEIPVNKDGKIQDYESGLVSPKPLVDAGVLTEVKAKTEDKPEGKVVEKKSDDKGAKSLTEFTNETPGRRKNSPKLIKRGSESMEEAETFWLKWGWNLDKIPHHWSSDKNELHAGQEEGCVYCKRLVKKLKKKDTSKNQTTNSPRRFEHKALNTEEDVIKCWNQIPKNCVPVAYMHFVGGSNLHMTAYYVPCGMDLALALYRFGKQVSAKNPKLKATVKSESTINSHLYPDKKIYLLNVRLDRGTRTVLDRLELRRWKPHVTDHSGKLKIGDVLDLIPEVECIYALVGEPSPGVQSYNQALKLEEAGSNSQKVISNVKLEKKEELSESDGSEGSEDSPRRKPSKKGSIGEGEDTNSSDLGRGTETSSDRKIK